MGEVFAGRYELLEPVAMGGMGTVWTIRDTDDGRLKVAKILQQSDAASLLRFVREQSVRIDHRHVVTPESWAGMDDRVLFTMPLVRGGSVADLLRRFGALPARWTATLLDQTLQALEAVHAAGIVHRDVKPANLLLEPTGRARPHLRLTDFGIAAPVDSPRMTRAGGAIGTPGYMPPEQEHGADPDPRQDLYSVGVVGLEMLSGIRPPAQGPVGPDLPIPRADDPRVAALVSLLRRAADPDSPSRPVDAATMRSELAALDLASMPAEPGEAIEVTDVFEAYDHPAAGTPLDASQAPTRTPHLDQGSGTPTSSPGSRAARAPSGPPRDPAVRRPLGQTVKGAALVGVGVVLLVLAAVLALSG
ncbi:serine/threonine-protein kinase [Nocardioides sp. CFH 31398]|uniref:serine/threonine-protein kinase n=1 Tax=Nocardioides sp. CFH 31398 TaxID=2919579 RepID=UPI001F05A4E9|nr:serine/threonine-protein kinase [Nocardioides sp. CFH 31398]MCH1868831.1 serine/threonine protein kinase [Nocardioides sp. CFH 31398]